ncbi:LuxR C-terminal-related transcriptional regulator [Rothia sp. AR01]|uniref:LuxR C-terminal-related transcriptional regulator n=1 Tax=Rothia santali TaxID=2949643 RepID=A0A9X2HDH2_9MICC|nr:LuxR C-terminal-related transcriptional regulator [Rothia santali]MCP3424862.1 LuxR C-terminal-related transcriptional regulator [Rothia santali]
MVATTLLDLKKAIWAGDGDALLDLVERRPLESWHAIRPWRMRRLLETLPRERAATSEVVRYVFGVSGGGGSRGVGPFGCSRLEEDQLDRGVWAQARELIDQRRSHPRAAMEKGRAARDLIMGRPEGIDPAVWKATCSYEAGVTNMLGGDLSAALECFGAVQAAEPPRRMAMYGRDSLVKSALIHVLFGDDELARLKLNASGYSGRTKSWVEDRIDLDTRFTRSILDDAERPGVLVERLPTARIASLGMMWPFYVYALWRACRSTGGEELFRARLTELERQVPEARRGDGFPRSAFPVALASFALQDGRVEEAESILEEADPQFFLTRLVRTRAALAAGRAEEAFRDAVALRGDTRLLRRTELRRCALGTEAALRCGRPEGAAALLAEGLERSGGLREGEMEAFTQRVRRFAEVSVPGWPQFEDAEAVRPRLTRRGAELLPALCSDTNRRDIADDLYISFNTLKTHQRMLYRKLGVRSRDELRLAAERIGFI